MTGTDVREHRAVIAEKVLRALEGTRWESAVLTYAQVGWLFEQWFECRDASGQRVEVSLPTVPLDWMRLKSAMADPARGAWLSAELRLSVDGTVDYAFNDDERIFWVGRDGPLQREPGAVVAPDDSDYIDELAAHPRAAEHLPAWFPRMSEPWVPVFETRPELVDAVAQYVGMDREEVLARHRDLPGDDAVYVVRPIRGGTALIVGRDGSALGAGSSMGPVQHRALFRAGRRNPEGLLGG